MFSFFSEKPTPTRLESTPELATLLPQLADLNAKARELEHAGTKCGPSSLEYRKQHIISPLKVQLDKFIADFNASPKHENHDDELKDVIQLIKNMAEAITETKQTFSTTLMTERNRYRHNLNSVIDSTTHGAAIVLPIAFSLGVLGLIASVVAAPSISVKTRSALNLTTPNTKSNLILTRLMISLNKIAENLKLSKMWFNLPETKYPEKFLCPITGVVFVDPVLCTLDNFTYERAAITKWLNEHRSSPLNRAKMNDNQTVADVLRPNKTLSDLIEEQAGQYPELADQKYHEPPRVSR
jgi:hypothetical protein